MFVEKRFEINSLFVYYKAGSAPLYGPKMKKGVMGRGKIEQFLSKFSLSFDKIAIFLVLFFGEMSFGISGGFRGGGGGRPPPPQGFDPLPTQRVPPLVLFKKSIFGRPTFKFFKGAFGANVY